MRLAKTSRVFAALLALLFTTAQTGRTIAHVCPGQQHEIAAEAHGSGHHGHGAASNEAPPTSPECRCIGDCCVSAVVAVPAGINFSSNLRIALSGGRAPAGQELPGPPDFRLPFPHGPPSPAVA